MKHLKVKFSTVLLIGFGLAGVQAQSVKDIDDNEYKTVIVGSQTWMAENLKTTRYNDGDLISLVTDDAAWVSRDSVALTNPSFYWYGNDPSNKNTYGALYNGYTVRTGKLCPSGWHVPADAEWSALTTYLGGEEVAGGKLKESGTKHWLDPNKGATNETGFTALPGGYRSMNGKFNYINGGSGWWSSTEYDPDHAWSRGMHSNTDHVSRGAGELPSGLYVRCVKD